jgi:hypothetical protein
MIWPSNRIRTGLRREPDAIGDVATVHGVNNLDRRDRLALLRHRDRGVRRLAVQRRGGIGTKANLHAGAAEAAAVSNAMMDSLCMTTISRHAPQ